MAIVFHAGARRAGAHLWLTAALPLGWRVLTVLALVGGTSVAQQRSASPASRTIEGSVFDQGGRTVAGAVVLLEDLKSLQVRSYIVQQDGTFHFRGLSADANYELRARFHGVTSGAKTVNVFQSKPLVTVNLTLTLKASHAASSLTTRSDSGKPL